MSTMRTKAENAEEESEGGGGAAPPSFCGLLLGGGRRLPRCCGRDCAGAAEWLRSLAQPQSNAKLDSATVAECLYRFVVFHYLGGKGKGGTFRLSRLKRAHSTVLFGRRLTKIQVIGFV